MAGLNGLPSLNELAQMEFMSPLANQQAQRQIDLGTQFANQNLAQGAQDLQTSTLKNLYDQQANPERLRGLQLGNTQTGLDNDIKGVQARSALDLEPEAKEAKRAAYLKQMDEDALASLTAKGESLSIRGAAEGDDAMAARGKKMMEAGRAELKQRNSLTAAADKATATAEGRLQGVLAQVQGAGERNVRDNETRRAVAEMRAKGAAKAGDILSGVASGKFTYEKAASSFGIMAAMEPDPEQAAKYQKLANQFEAARAQDTDRMAGKPDLQKLGIDVNMFKPALGGLAGTNASPPVQQVAPSANPTSAMAGPSSDDRINVLAQEYKNTNDPVLRESLKREATRLGFTGDLGGGQAAPKPAAPVSQLPPGSKQIGTSGGKPVYQTPDGQKFLGK